MGPPVNRRYCRRSPDTSTGWEETAVTEPCRVVICDDVADFRLLIVTALKRSAGLVVAGQAANGQEAVDLARSEQPDVVLLDIAMPVMDGMEALPLIRDASPGSKVIMLTGFAGDDTRSRALSSGAVGYIEKGVLTRVIIDAVRDACSS